MHVSVARGGRALLAIGLGALCLGVSTAGAAVDQNDPSLVEFSVPNQAAIDKLNNLGFDLAEYRRANPDGTIEINAMVTPEQRAQFEAMGYPAGQTIETPQTQAEVRAEADAAAAAQARSESNLKAGRNTAPRGSKSAAATDTVLASRADYFENYAGRYISVEARTTDGSSVTANNPVMSVAWDSGAGTALGGTGQEGTLTPFIDTDPPDGRYYLYHYNLFRVGDLNDGKPMPSKIRVASSHGGVDEIPVKEWVSKDGKGFPAQYVQDFNTSYVDPQIAYSRISALATEFPNLAQIYDLPNKTAGYQRKSQTILGLKTPYTNATGSLGAIGNSTTNPDETAAIRQSQAVVLTSVAWGQDGGNDITAQLVNSSTPNAPLSVAVADKAITVSLATDAAGAATSTAADVVAAINGNAAASALVSASKYRTNTGLGKVVAGAAPTKLSDFLNAPASYPRGPQTVKMIRIGAHRDGTKTGVFIYCEEHAREWATSLVCLETVERLLRNYATDPETKSLLDNLDIFVIPVVNADGMAYSRYDFTSQRRNMVDYCASNPTGNNDPLARNSWGVDINRNFSVGSYFDGYVGASGTCTSDVFAGPSEFSEPESRNEQWVQNTFSNIKFANNVHSYGGYFMWPPGSYKNVGRETLPYGSAGTNQFFEQTANTTLERIKAYRKTTVLPSRTGPVADVLYSAAGNSADEAYYSHGIYGYDFEIGVDRFVTTGACTTPGAVVNQNSSSCVAPVGFTPTYAPEGHDEGMEFASGNIGLLNAALAYSNDHSPPVVKAVLTPVSTGLDLTFTQDEPADIYYTTDGSTPTTSSNHYQPAGPRQRQQPVHLAGPVTLKWIAVDVKGQTSAVQTQVYTSPPVNGDVGGSVPATLSLTLGTPASFGSFQAGVARDYLSSTTATVTSSAGNAALIVTDPSPFYTNHLVNGSFALAQELQVKNNTGAYQTMPAGIRFWGGPTASEVVPIDFKQSIGANEPLRSGSYGKTLTFTLSTTAP